MDLRILIAEDEPHLSAVLCDYFLSRGDRPTPALNGTVALELAQAEEFDGVLLDIMMPGLNGLSVCRAIRKESDIPIIFLTALSDEEDKLLGYELGADDYISEDMILTADEGRMEQVISNLMSNAVKYTPESGSIYLRLHQKNGNAHFYIENTADPLS